MNINEMLDTVIAALEEAKTQVEFAACRTMLHNIEPQVDNAIAKVTDARTVLNYIKQDYCKKKPN